MSASTSSKLRSAFITGTWNLLSSIEADIGSSREIVVDKGKLIFNYLRLLSSTPLHSTNTSSHSTRSESITEKKNSFSIIGRLYRVSLPVPPFPTCEFQRVSMASSSKDLFSGQWTQNLRHAQVEKPKGCNNLSFDFKSGNRRGKVFMSLKDAERPNNFLVYGYLSYNVYKRSSCTARNSESGVRNFHSSGFSCGLADPAGDVFDNSSHRAQSGGPVDRPEPKIPVERSMKLISGSCYLPHPDKEDTGGEDAHFICEDEQAIGVADGVGGWADVGINAGLFARELMSHSVNAVQEEPKGDVDPVRVLTKAHSSTKAKGSSTACIIALTDKGLRAVNLGDSGFMVVRDGSTIFRSPVQQHDFNFTYQLESGTGGDLPSSGQTFTISVTTGDVMVAGTDGLFDNLYNSEVTAVVVQATRAGLGPQAAAQNIAALARQRALDKDRQTPFSTAAQDAGFRYYGGKLDDITVVVSYITGSTEVQLMCGSG